MLNYAFMYELKKNRQKQRTIDEQEEKEFSRQKSRFIRPIAATTKLWLGKYSPIYHERLFYTTRWKEFFQRLSV